MNPTVIYVGVSVIVLLFFAGVRVVRPTSRGLVERLGKYQQLALPGFNWIIPFVGNAQLLRKLIMVETAFSANTKIVIPAKTELVNVIGEMAGILPLGRTAVPLKAGVCSRGRSGGRALLM